MRQFDTPTSRCKQIFFCYTCIGFKYQCIWTAQRLVFIWGKHHRFKLNEELICVEAFQDTATGKDLFNTLENCVEISGLVLKKMASVITDGAGALTRKSSVINKSKEYQPDNTLLPLQVEKTGKYMQWDVYFKNKMKAGLCRCRQ